MLPKHGIAVKYENSLFLYTEASYWDIITKNDLILIKGFGRIKNCCTPKLKTQ